MISLILGAAGVWVFECRRELLALVALEILLRWTARFLTMGSTFSVVTAFLVGVVFVLLARSLFSRKGGAK